MRHSTCVHAHTGRMKLADSQVWRGLSGPSSLSSSRPSLISFYRAGADGKASVALRVEAAPFLPSLPGATMSVAGFQKGALRTELAGLPHPNWSTVLLRKPQAVIRPRQHSPL